MHHIPTDTPSEHGGNSPRRYAVPHTSAAFFTRLQVDPLTLTNRPSRKLSLKAHAAIQAMHATTDTRPPHGNAPTQHTAAPQDDADDFTRTAQPLTRPPEPKQSTKWDAHDTAALAKLHPRAAQHHKPPLSPADDTLRKRTRKKHTAPLDKQLSQLVLMNLERYALPRRSKKNKEQTPPTPAQHEAATITTTDTPTIEPARIEIDFTDARIARMGAPDKPPAVSEIITEAQRQRRDKQTVFFNGRACF